MTAYTDRIEQLLTCIAEKNRLMAKRKLLRDQETMYEKEVRELGYQKDREDADVTRLEETSLKNIWYGIVGKKEQLLTKEKAEAYAAALKYEAAVASLAAVRQELDEVASALLPLRDCETAYELALREKRSALLDAETPEAEELLRLEALLVTLAGQEKELKEAITAGEQANSIIVSLRSSLDSAENMGIWDTWVGGGIVADLAKHSHLDDAQNKVTHLQNALRRFGTELTDVKVQAELQVNIEGFPRFADFFFDGIFADFMVLDRIRSSKEQVAQTGKQLTEALKKLRTMEAVVRQEKVETEAKKTLLIRQASL